MTDFRFESDEIEDPEIVSEFSIDDYEKYRLKANDLTIDLAIVDLDGRDKDEYIQGRKEELASENTEVPHPYKPEKTQKENSIDTVEFDENLLGQGYADPEYNLISEDETKIVRYKYVVTWKHFLSENKLAEIEIYLPKDLESRTEAIIDAVKSLDLT